jgi:hypothetical protein
MDARSQRDTLLRVVGLEESLLALQVERDGLLEKRRDAGRDVKRLEAESASLEVVGEDTPATEVDLDALAAELQEAIDEKAKITKEQVALSQMFLELLNLEERVRELKKAIKETEDWLSTKESPDVDSIRRRLNEAEKTNRLVREKQRTKEISAALEKAKSDHEVLCGMLEDLEEQKEKALRAARFPIEGLGVDAEGVTFKGLPFEQASSSEQLKVSMAVAMAMNPRLRVLRINDGSLLDESNMRLIARAAAENDYQVWVERVEPSSESAVIIEDGTIQQKGA